MSLDVQTLYILGVPVAIIAAASVLLFGRWVPDARGTTAWAMATLCFGAIGVLYAGRSSLPFFLTVVVGNTLYVTSAALYHFAACRIRSVSYPALLHISIIVLIAVSFKFVFTDLKADYVARVLLVCPLLAIQYFLTARTLLGDRQAVSQEEYLVLVFGAVPFILLGLGFIWRSVIHIPGVAVPTAGLLSNTANSLVTKVTYLLAMVFFPYVFIQMNNVISRQRVQRSESRMRKQNAILAGINRVFKEALTCETEGQLSEVCLAVAEELTGSRFGFIGELNKERRKPGRPGHQFSRLGGL